MPIHITVSFEPQDNVTFFDIDTSAMTNSKGVASALYSAFRRLDGEEWDNLFALGETRTSARVTDNLSSWRHVARSIEHGMGCGHLWDLLPDDCEVQWKTADGMMYDNPRNIPGPEDVVHALGTTTISNFLRVGDPCYSWKEFNDTEVPVLPGQWTFEMTVRDDAKDGMANGHRPARLVAYNADAGPLDMKTLLTSAKPHTSCGVDSATCGFMFDEQIPNPGPKKDAWYNSIIDPIIDRENEGPPSANFAPDLHAVIASTFYGDGSYPMFVQYNDAGQAIAVALVTDHGDPLVKQNPHIEREYDDDLEEDGMGL